MRLQAEVQRLEESTKKYVAKYNTFEKDGKILRKDNVSFEANRNSNQ